MPMLLRPVLLALPAPLPGLLLPPPAVAQGGTPRILDQVPRRGELRP